MIISTVVHYIVTSWYRPQIISSVQTPLPDTQTSRLSLDNLGVVEEAVEYLPEKDDGHQNEVDTTQDDDVGLHRLGQLLPSVDSFVILSKMPLIERGLGKEKQCSGGFCDTKTLHYL